MLGKFGVIEHMTVGEEIISSNSGYVLSGVFAAYEIPANDSKIMPCIYQASDLIGTMALHGVNSKRKVTALTTSAICWITPKEYQAWVGNLTESAREEHLQDMHRQFCSDIAQRDRLLELSLLSVPERVYLQLCRLTDLNVPVSRPMLASLAGTSPEVCSRALRDMLAKGKANQTGRNAYIACI